MLLPHSTPPNRWTDLSGSHKLHPSTPSARGTQDKMQSLLHSLQGPRSADLDPLSLTLGCPSAIIVCFLLPWACPPLLPSDWNILCSGGHRLVTSQHPHVNSNVTSSGKFSWMPVQAGPLVPHYHLFCFPFFRQHLPLPEVPFPKCRNLASPTHHSVPKGFSQCGTQGRGSEMFPELITHPDKGPKSYFKYN